MSRDTDIKDIIKLHREQKLWRNNTEKEMLFNLIPSIALNQYHVFRYKNTGVAYAFTNWALLSDEVENKFKQTGILKKFEWDSGNNLWHINTINTHHGKIKTIYKWTILNFLKSFPETKIINWLRLNETNYTIKRINKMTIKNGMRKF
jgi:hemolysin-activating ACP:hemolysin acyltransferase|tara:strand:+ start:92 stop:535 length:444 start_codon:yes stop_codon:yes gene_type:complete